MSVSAIKALNISLFGGWVLVLSYTTERARDFVGFHLATRMWTSDINNTVYGGSAKTRYLRTGVGTRKILSAVM